MALTIRHLELPLELRNCKSRVDKRRSRYLSRQRWQQPRWAPQITAEPRGPPQSCSLSLAAPRLPVEPPLRAPQLPPRVFRCPHPPDKCLEQGFDTRWCPAAARATRTTRAWRSTTWSQLRRCLECEHNSHGRLALILGTGPPHGWALAPPFLCAALGERLSPVGGGCRDGDCRGGGCCSPAAPPGWMERGRAGMPADEWGGTREWTNEWTNGGGRGAHRGGALCRRRPAAPGRARVWMRGAGRGGAGRGGAVFFFNIKASRHSTYPFGGSFPPPPFAPPARSSRRRREGAGPALPGPGAGCERTAPSWTAPSCRGTRRPGTPRAARPGSPPPWPPSSSSPSWWTCWGTSWSSSPCTATRSCGTPVSGDGARSGLRELLGLPPRCGGGAAVGIFSARRRLVVLFLAPTSGGRKQGASEGGI